MANTGAVVNQAGACAKLAVPTILASGSSSRCFASLSRMRTSAAAPSEMELELAGVTVPPSRNAGLSLGIFAEVGRERLLVLLHLDRAAAALDGDGHDLARKRAVLVGPLRALQALDRERVLRLARELVVLRRILGEAAHQPALVVGILQPVEEHVVLDLGVPEPARRRASWAAGRAHSSCSPCRPPPRCRPAARAARRRPASPPSCPSRTSC